MTLSKDSAQFTVERTYTVRRPKFTLFRNVEYLDTAKLAKGSHTIELGRFEGSSCDCAVIGKVRDGMIVAIEHPKCEKSIKMPAELNEKLQAAGRQLAELGPSKWQDIPVGDLTGNPAALARIIVTTGGDGTGCYWVCIDPGDGKETCWMCCPKEGWCIGPSEPALAMF